MPLLMRQHDPRTEKPPRRPPHVVIARRRAGTSGNDCLNRCACAERQEVAGEYRTVCTTRSSANTKLRWQCELVVAGVRGVVGTCPASHSSETAREAAVFNRSFETGLTTTHITQVGEDKSTVALPHRQSGHEEHEAEDDT